MRFPPLSLPVARPSDEPTEMLCLNHDWVIELLSLTERLEFDTAWLQPVDEIDLNAKVLELQQMLVRAGTMSCCCKQPTNRRYNADGVLEVSYDGGITWTPAPELDDRNSGTISPPLGGADGSDKRCLGAASAMEFVKQNFIDDLQDGESYANIYAAAVAVVAILGVTGIGLLIAAAAAAIFIAGVAAVQAAFTSTVWSDFQCILYCNSEDDASFTAAGWEQVKSEILSTFTGVVSAVLYNWVNSVGLVGLTNAARSGFAAAADCSECECDDTWCYNFDFSLGEQEWTKIITGGYNNANYQSGSGWRFGDFVNLVQDPDTANRLVYIKRAMASATITKVTMTYKFTGGSYDATALFALFIAMNGSNKLTITRAAMVDGDFLEAVWEGSQGGVTEVELWLRSSRDISSPYTYGGDALIRSVQLEGTGNNPFGLDNCP